MSGWEAARGFDPRLKIALGLWLGLLLWRTPPLGLAVYAAGLGWLLTAPRLRAAVLASGRSMALFALLFAGLKAGADLLGGVPAAQAAAAAGLLAARLGLLLALGLALAATASPRALGLGFSWYLRPLAGRGAWRAALALALMIHFQPLVWQAFGQVRHTVSRRCAGLGLRRSLELYAAAGLRALSQKTWGQAVAIAARKLDDPDAWTGLPPLRAAQVRAFTALAGAAWLLAVV